MIKCVVLDYSNGDVNMHEFSAEELTKATTPEIEAENMGLSDVIESILSKTYNLNSINYMFGDNININF